MPDHGNSYTLISPLAGGSGIVTYFDSKDMTISQTGFLGTWNAPDLTKGLKLTEK
jgi:hypothetical protein